jgi:hypothetical protein
MDEDAMSDGDVSAGERGARPHNDNKLFLCY